MAVAVGDLYLRAIVNPFSRRVWHGHTSFQKFCVKASDIRHKYVRLHAALANIYITGDNFAVSFAEMYFNIAAADDGLDRWLQKVTQYLKS